MNTSNFVNLIGRIGQVPKRVNFDSGGALLELSLATNHSYKDRDGNRVKKTDWHRVKCFGPVIETLERYVQVGDQLSVVGSLRYREWTDKFDQRRQTAEIILDSFSFIGGNKREADSQENNPINARNPDPLNQPQPTYAGEFGDPKSVALSPEIDLPF